MGERRAARDVPGKMLSSEGSGCVDGTFCGVAEGDGNGEMAGSTSFDELAVVPSEESVGVES